MNPAYARRATRMPGMSEEQVEEPTQGGIRVAN